MSIKKADRRLRIHRSIRKKIKGVASRPRLSIFRSNSGIYAQLIDDENGVTISSISSKKLVLKGTKIEQSKQVGAELAKEASSKGISEIVFDRGGYLYHGRVQALADGVREGGLKF